MKKAFLILVFIISGSNQIMAQESATAKGSWLVESGIGTGLVGNANTSLAFASNNGNSSFVVGGEAGYFIKDNLALKAGVSYGSEGDYVNWKAGAKYYFSSKIPVQFDLNGSINSFLPSVMVGIQGGYAWFVADNISIEPGIRYLLGISDEYDAYGATVAFSLFF